MHFPLAPSPASSKNRGRSWLNLANGLAIATVVVLLAVLPQVGVDGATVLPLALLTGVASIQLYSFFTDSGQSDLFVPTTLVTVYFLTYFGLRAYGLEGVPFFPRSGRTAYDDYIPFALWCAVMGYVLFLLGTKWNLAPRLLRHIPVARLTWPTRLPTLPLLIFLAMGVGSQLYLFKIGQAVGNFTNSEFQRHPPPGIAILLLNAMDLVWIIVCIYLLKPDTRRDRSAAWFLFVLCLIAIAIRLGVSGGKVALIQPALEAALVYNYARRRLKIWELAAIGVPLIMLSFGIVNFYRFVVVAQHGVPKSLSDVFDRVSETSELLTEHRGAARSASSLRQLMERDAGVDSLALVLKYTGNPFPYQYGKAWAEIPITFIPRQIWKNKPVSMPAAEFEHTYLAEPYSYNGFTSLHLIADFYRNFAWPGVIFGMIGIGVLMRLVYLYCAPSSSNLPGLFLYAVIFPNLVHSFEVTLDGTIITFVRILCLTWVMGYFCGIRYRRLPGISRRKPFAMVHQPYREAVVFEAE